MKLYTRARIERWIAEHPDLVQATQAKKKAAAKSVATKRAALRREVAAQIAQFQMRPAPPDQLLRRQAWDYYHSQFDDFDGRLTERALCAYVRHNYTNYDDMLAAMAGRCGKSEVYRIAKALVTCRIVREYRLSIHPLYAAFGGEYHRLFPQLAERSLAEIEEALWRMLEEGDGALRRVRTDEVD